MSTRNQMKKALQQVVVPHLRELGFRGTFPHFRRRSDWIDLVTFQFDSYGGGFIIELGRCGLEEYTTDWGKQIPPDRLTTWYLPMNQRTRIQPRPGGGADSWFRYDSATTTEDFVQIARSALALLAPGDRLFDNIPFHHGDAPDSFTLRGLPVALRNAVKRLLRRD